MKDVEYIQNDDSMDLLFHNNHDKLLCVGIIVNVGSVNENNENNGISHYLEHVLFSGTKKFSSDDISTKLSDITCEYNAETSKIYTIYYLEAYYKDFKVMVDIVYDMYYNPLFPKDKIDKERGVIIDELNIYNSSFNMYDFIFTTLYKNQSVSMPIGGDIKNIKKITHIDIKNFYDKYYTNNNSIMFCVGKYNKQIKKYIINKFKNNPEVNKKNINNINYTNLIKPITNYNGIDKIHIVDNNDDYTNLYITFNLQGIKNRFIGSLLTYILSHDNNSILYSSLRTYLGMTYSPSTYYSLFVNSGLFIIDVSFNLSNIKIIIQTIINELIKLKKNGITDYVFNKYKRYIYMVYIVKRTYPHRTLNNILHGYIYKYVQKQDLEPFINDKMIYDMINTSSLEYINDLINDIISLKNINIFLYTKLKKNDQIIKDIYDMFTFIDGV